MSLATESRPPPALFDYEPAPATEGDDEDEEVPSRRPRALLRPCVTLMAYEPNRASGRPDARVRGRVGVWIAKLLGGRGGG